MPIAVLLPKEYGYILVCMNTKPKEIGYLESRCIINFSKKDVFVR